jgi:protein-tyrosine phosphatase
MIDLHTHILPGIDDGVQTIEDSVEFARVASEDGVKTIVATPHYKEGVWENHREGILDGVRVLRERMSAEGLQVNLLPGAEVHLCPDLVGRVKDGRATTLNDNGRTVLLELSLTQYPVELDNLVFQMKLAGLQVLLAHPERIRFFQDDIRRYESVVQLGAYGQITTGSMLGTFGSDARRFTEELLRKGLVHVLASDAHNVRGRPPILSEALEAIEPWVGQRRAEIMATDAPAAFLEGREPELPPVERRVRSGRSLLGRLFGRRQGSH